MLILKEELLTLKLLTPAKYLDAPQLAAIGSFTTT